MILKYFILIKFSILVEINKKIFSQETSEEDRLFPTMVNLNERS